MVTVTVSTRFQVVIPKLIREDIGLHPGDKMIMFEKDGIIHLLRMEDIKEMKGRYKGLKTDYIRDEYDRF